MLLTKYKLKTQPKITNLNFKNFYIEKQVKIILITQFIKIEKLKKLILKK